MTFIVGEPSILVAGIIAMAAGMGADVIIHPETPEEKAYHIEVAAVSTANAAPAAAELPPITPLLAAADVNAGKKKSKACAACHTFDKGGADRVGPNLWDIVGRDKAGTAGFAYSDALVEKGGAWDYEALNAFLAKPKKYTPGTKMNYAGLKKEKDRANLIAWLRSLSDSPQPIE